MSRTLHAYFFRELIKAFLLTTIALTILVTMGGGVANVFRSQGVEAARVARVFLLLVPIAVTLVMPIAALFAATITYGRSSADNEINACRAAGINVHVLLLSAVALSVVVSAFTYWSWNYMIPGLTERVYQYGRKDVPTLLLSNLRRNRAMTWGNYVLYADEAAEVSRDQLPPDAPEDRQYLLLKSAAFLELAGIEPLRAGTTEAAVIEFDTSGALPQLRIDLQGVRNFDIARGQYMEFEHQLMGPYEIPLPLGKKLRFQDLPSLRAFAAAPETIPELNDRIWGVRTRLMRVFAYQSAVAALDRELGGSGTWRLTGRGAELEVRAGQYTTTEDDGQPYLKDVTVIEKAAEGTRQLTAAGGTVRVIDTLNRSRPLVQVELTGGVEIRGVPHRREERVVKQPSIKLRGMPLPADAQERLDALSDAKILDLGVAIPAPAKVVQAREKLIDSLEQLRCEVTSVIHFRSSYALSTVAVVVMGAILGVVLRGGQVLTAFGISCVPSLVVVVGTILGRNLAEHPATHEAGVAAMWAADVVLAAATVIVGLKFLRR